MVQLYTCVGVSPVEDLQFSFTSNNSLNMTWSPPVYNSDDIPIDSTLSYNVILTNKTGDIIVDTTTTNTFTEVVNITDCDTFNVSVTALKGQYVSINNTKGNNGSKRNCIFNFWCMQSTLGFAVNIESSEQEFLKPVIFFQVTGSFI